MKFIGPLMWEHRLIEEMLKKVEEEVGNMEKKNRFNPLYIDQVVDFGLMRTGRITGKRRTSCSKPSRTSP